MGGQKQTAEKVQGAPGAAPAARPPEGTAEEAAAEKTAKKSAAELQREMLSEGLKGVDRETADLIMRVDVNKEAKEQSENVQRLQLVSMTLFAKIFESGVQVKDLQTLDSISKIDTSKLSLNACEKIALDKLLEIGSTPGKKLNKEMASIWPQVVDNMRSRYESGSNAKKVITGEQKETKDKDANVIVKFAKEHPYATAAIAIAGAVGIYKLFFSGSKEEKKEEKSEGGILSKLFSKTTLIIVGLLIVGGLIGPENIKDALMKFYKISGERISKCIALWKEGRYKDAIWVLFAGEDEHAKEYEQLAGIISKDTGKEVNDSAIQGVANAKYSEFTSPESKAKSFMAQAMGVIPGMGGAIAGLFADSKEKIDQENAIRDYLEKNRDKIIALNLGRDATVFDVLAKLNNISTTTTDAGKEGAPEANRSESGEVVDTGSEYGIAAASQETYQEIVENLKDKPTVAAMLKKYDGHLSDIIFHPQDFFKELTEACKQDGVSIILGAGKIILLNGATYIEITSWVGLYHSALAQIKDPLSFEGVKTYAAEAVPFTVIGAVGGLLSMAEQKTIAGKLLHVGKSTARGFIFPVEIAKFHVVAGKRIYRTGKEITFKAQRTFGSAEARPRILEAETQYLAELAKKYDDLYIAKGQNEITLKKVFAKLDSKRIAALREEYLGKFAESYNRLHPDAKLRINPGDPSRMRDVEDKLDEFLKREKTPPAIPETAAEAAVAEEAMVESGAPETLEASEAPVAAETLIPAEPEWLGKTGTGPETMHRYKFQNQEIEINEGDIGRAAQRVALEEKAAGRVSTPKENWNKAIKLLAEDSLRNAISQTPVEFTPATEPALEGAPKAEYLGDVSAESQAAARYRLEAKELGLPELFTGASDEEAISRYKFKGQEVELKASDIHQVAKKVAAEEIAKGNAPARGAEKAWNDANWEKAAQRLVEEKMLPTATITETRIAANGTQEFKIGDTWEAAEVPTDPVKLATFKQKFISVLGKEGKIVKNVDAFFANAKTIKLFGVLEKIAGPTVAALTIYHLETAPDKRKAVAETAAGFGTFWAGMKLADWTVGGKISNPLARTVVDLMGGFATALGLTEPIGSVVESYFKSMPAGYGISREIGHIMEVGSGYMLGKSILASAEKGLLKKAVMKMGLEKIGVAFEKKIGGALLKKISSMVAKSGFKTLLKGLGWKGVAATGILADDASGFGVIDDLLLIPLTIMSIKDIYDIRKLFLNAKEIEVQMASRTKKPIESFKIKDRASRMALTEKLTPLGLTLETAAQQLSETEFFDLLRTLPMTAIEIKRAGLPGKEIWTMSKGEAVGISVLDASGEILCEINDEDAGMIDKSIDEVEKSKA
ncbi:MAG: hypothetical protein NTX63_03435 [Candidatus Peregrinibacteria bacterium]|nr:hypothetical protein [Candidatus Peregrinibacteria bacterium]